MKVSVRFYSHDLPDSFRSCTLELPLGATVLSVLERYSASPELQISRDEFMNYTTIMLNGVSSRTDAVLHDGDILLLMRTMEGG